MLKTKCMRKCFARLQLLISPHMLITNALWLFFITRFFVKTVGDLTDLSESAVTQQKRRQLILVTFKTIRVW